jgi:multidrug efflux pump subunit AcrA (membrane-fusion protein)
MEEKFIRTQKVSASLSSTNLELVGEIGINPQKTVLVVPVVSGRVTKVLKRAGDLVKAGELLAILQSQEYGKAKLDYISACQRYKLAEKSYKWFKISHENLKKMLDIFQKSSKDSDLPKIPENIKMGKYKKQLVEGATQYRLTNIKYDKEKQVVQNLRKLLPLLKESKTQKGERELKALQIGEWKGKLLGAMSKLMVAEKNFEREKKLAISHASTQKELQEAESNYYAAQAEYQALLEEASFWLEQKEKEIQAELASSLATYLSVLEEIEIDLEVHHLEVEKEYQEALNQKATKEKWLYLLGLTAQEMEKISMHGHGGEESLRTLEIRAPIAGTIISFQISEGQFVEANKELCTISDLETLWVWGDLYEHDLSSLKSCSNKLEELSVSIEVVGETRLAKVAYIADIVQEKTRTVKMRLAIANTSKSLKPGMFVKIYLKIPGKEKITLPEGAIFKEENQSFVFRKWKGNLWIRTDVALGTRIGNYYEILRGLQAGDTIASEGGFMLKSEIFKGKMGAG